MKSPAITATVVNGIVLERLDVDSLINFSSDLWEQGREAKDEGEEAEAAAIWVKYQTVCAAINARGCHCNYSARQMAARPQPKGHVRGSNPCVFEPYGTAIV